MLMLIITNLEELQSDMNKLVHRLPWRKGLLTKCNQGETKVAIKIF